MYKAMPLVLFMQLAAFPSDTTAQAIMSFGLVGRWAEDCARTPTMEGFEVPQLGDSSFYIVKVKENEVTYRAKIVHAEIVSPDTLIWQYTDTGNNMYSLTIKKTPEGGIRTMTMVNQKREKTIENGYSVGQNPRSEPVLTKCN